MKIIREGKVYLQKIDVDFIRNELDSPPYCILDEIYHPENTSTSEDKIFGAHVNLKLQSKNPYKFDFEFVRPNNIVWLISQFWLIDYDEYRIKSVEEIEQILKQERQELKSNQTVDDPDILRKEIHLCQSLSIMCDYVAGKIKFRLPKELILPNATSESSQKEHHILEVHSLDKIFKFNFFQRLMAKLLSHIPRSNNSQNGRYYPRKPVKDAFRRFPWSKDRKI